jgi:hypothetical protein
MSSSFSSCSHDITPFPSSTSKNSKLDMLPQACTPRGGQSVSSVPHTIANGLALLQYSNLSRERAERALLTFLQVCATASCKIINGESNNKWGKCYAFISLIQGVWNSSYCLRFVLYCSWRASPGSPTFLGTQMYRMETGTLRMGILKTKGLWPLVQNRFPFAKQKCPYATFRFPKFEEFWNYTKPH